VAAGTIGTLGVEYVVLRVMASIPRLLSGVLSTAQVVEDAAELRDAAQDDLARAERLLRDRGAPVRGLVRPGRT
jgi:hypothetical protein